MKRLMLVAALILAGCVDVAGTQYLCEPSYLGDYMKKCIEKNNDAGECGYAARKTYCERLSKKELQERLKEQSREREHREEQHEPEGP